MGFLSATDDQKSLHKITSFCGCYLLQMRSVDVKASCLHLHNCLTRRWERDLLIEGGDMAYYLLMTVQAIICTMGENKKLKQ